MTERYIYHVCKLEEWDEAQELGRYSGSSQDKADGFIHFSGRGQVHGSVAKHRAGQDGLVLLEVDSTLLGETLKWEPSRGGVLFPHLYGDLSLTAVTRTATLNLTDEGAHDFPSWLSE
ncbi:glutathione S-transferase [Kiloniella spongiae]|uniref:Glutathione S-transferase n=1 Tax=Kiloniella spongiae TaxID=1489064 RepID=A0A0H2MAU5_9PROT|nr:DUF952 domain-containing protein [Kiloniella spongiae]KLN59428.1 glutathione S-transferase [Kiloniella spongiae]